MRPKISLLKAPQRVPKDPSWHDVIVDPDNILPKDIVDKFKSLNQQFSVVFQPDLPAYNGAFGRVEASINIPQNMPPSERLKQAPWYPKKLINELQDYFDDLGDKGVLAAPQDLIPPVHVEAMSPSFLVAKKSKGYRMVTSFGHLAACQKSSGSHG